jgi:hypothetical protein
MELFIALIIPTTAGYPVAMWALGAKRKNQWAETLCLGYGLGTGLTTFAIFLHGIIRIPFNLPSITILLSLFSALFIYLIYRDRKTGGVSEAKACPEPDTSLRGIKSYIAAFIILLIIFKAGFVLYEASIRPIFSWDASVNWSMVAKFFYYEKGLALTPGGENYFGTGYRQFLGHPLHFPLLKVWAAMWIGDFHEAYVKIWSAFFFLSIIGLFYTALSREVGRFYAVVWTFFLSSAPLLAYHGTDAYSDLLLSYYSLASIFCLLRYMKKEDYRLLVISGILIGTGVFTKNEGIIFAIAFAIALLLYSVLTKKNIVKTLLPYVVAFLVIAGPWLLFKTVNDIGFGHSGVGSELEWFSDPLAGKKYGPIHWIIFPDGFKEVFIRTANFNFILPLWIILSVIGFRKILKTNLKYIYLYLGLVIIAFIFIYLTLEVRAVSSGSGVHRNILTYLPIIYFSTALLLKSLLKVDPKDSPEG